MDHSSCRVLKNDPFNVRCINSKYIREYLFQKLVKFKDHNNK